MIKKCIACGKEFKADYPSKKYCSSECFIKDRKSKSIVTKKCEWCGKEFSSPLGEQKRFCSNECVLEWERNHFKGKNNPVWKEKIILKCEHCGKEFSARPIEVEEGKKFCSRKCYEEYRQKQLNLETRKCKRCEKEFNVPQKSKQQFCSRDCYRKWLHEY
jgi:predicted nucleic acid-binding Zn ribbon protein